MAWRMDWKLADAGGFCSNFCNSSLCFCSFGRSGPFLCERFAGAPRDMVGKVEGVNGKAVVMILEQIEINAMSWFVGKSREDEVSN